jgi:hypothetical protein
MPREWIQWLTNGTGAERSRTDRRNGRNSYVALRLSFVIRHLVSCVIRAGTGRLGSVVWFHYRDENFQIVLILFVNCTR